MMRSIPTVVLASMLILNSAALTAASPPPSPRARTLSEAQKNAMRSIQAESERQSVPVAQKLGETLRSVYANLLSDKPDAALDRKLDGEIKETAGQLLSIKSRSIRDIVALLTPEQKTLVRSEFGKTGVPDDPIDLIVHVLGSAEK
jgi:Spy/CpxP family protein refolding chaperone